MTLTVKKINRLSSDEKLLDALFSELEKQIPEALHDDLDVFVTHLKTLSPGLRAMAATYQLDISVTMDDLCWHFANWHHKRYCKETQKGLQELEATRAAEIFSAAYTLTLPCWRTIGRLVADDFNRFVQWYKNSDLERAFKPLDQRMWRLLDKKPHGLFTYWIGYARKYPERVV